MSMNQDDAMSDRPIIFVQVEEVIDNFQSLEKPMVDLDDSQKCLLDDLSYD